jgi:hypothetical protein
MLRACPRSAPEATAMVRTPPGSGANGHEAPGLTREPEVKWSGPQITPSDSRSGVHDSAAAVLYYFERPPKITSHHVTALCRLDLRHQTRAEITSHYVTALCRLDLRPATAPEPDARAHPGDHSPSRLAHLGHALSFAARRHRRTSVLGGRCDRHARSRVTARDSAASTTVKPPRDRAPRHPIPARSRRISLCY